MKLELKYLAAYFHYDLEVRSDDKNYTLIGISKSNVSLDHEIYLSFITNISKIKPILRPLEDLFFNMNIENESIKPFEYLEDFADTEIERMFLDIIKNQNSKFILDKIQYAPFSFISKFLEWHFDIFGLIDAGLAVDINCL